MIPNTTVEILDKTLKVVGEFKSLYPLNNQKAILRYSGELSNYGSCTFRLSPLDPALTQFGDILIPHQYHVRLKRGNTVIWQGAIVDNPHRNKHFIEVLAHEYEYYLDRVQIKRTSPVGYGEVTPLVDVGQNYRIFSSGTMADAVTALLTEAKAALGPNHILANMQLDTIENPDFPPNFTNSLGNALTGPWTFSSDVVVQFDYQSVLYALKQFGIYAMADFAMTKDLKFSFKKFYGSKSLNEVFSFGEEGNIIDFDVPRSGKRMTNDLIGIATQPDGTILHAEKRDEASIAANGLLQDTAGYIDVKDSNILTARLAEKLRLVSTYDSAPLNLLLDEKSYPLGQFSYGDLVRAKIKWGGIDYEAPRRIVGYTVTIHDTGREFIIVQTNVPNPRDLGEVV